MEAGWFPETLISTYPTKRCDKPENQSKLWIQTPRNPQISSCTMRDQKVRSPSKMGIKCKLRSITILVTLWTSAQPTEMENKTIHVLPGLLIRNPACEQEQMLLLASCQQTCMTYTTAVCTAKNSWWWTDELSEHVQFHSKNKFEKSTHIVGFILRNLSRSTVTWTSYSPIIWQTILTINNQKNGSINM
jgi:hypothetical protein